MADAEGRTILITGATDGLGKKVAEDLAAAGATLLLHGRNAEKGEEVLGEIREKTGSDRHRYYNADLSSLEAAGRLAERIVNHHGRLDVLVNNAGLGAGPRTDVREVSVEGGELRFAVNYLAPFLLTRKLLPLLRRTAQEDGEARIVNVASAAQQELDFEDLMLERGYSGMRAYAQSKLALILFTLDLAEELKGTGVAANALHPASLMDTKMVREWFGAPRTSVDEGARALERLAAAEDLKGVTGKYFDGEKEARAKAQAYDPEARRKLREWSERAIAALD